MRLPSWWPILPAIVGLCMILNEGIVHRANPNGSLIGTGITLLTGSLVVKAANGNGQSS